MVKIGVHLGKLSQK